MANRHTKAKALSSFTATAPPTAPNWDRIRARFASLGCRGTPMPIISTGIHVQASSPEELRAKSDQVIADAVKDQPES